MLNLKLLFPTKLPYITRTKLHLPNDMNLGIKGLLGNDLLYLVLHHCDKEKSNEQYRQASIRVLKRDRVYEWRRKKRLQKLGLI